MILSEIISIFSKAAPLAYQESYDNSGLSVGDPTMPVNGALLCVDVTMEVVDEAITLGINLIISHHPLIFSPLKQITGKNLTEKIIITAIKNNIAIFSAHTNLDNVLRGVNAKICQKLGIERPRILVPQKKDLFKVVTYVPVSHADEVRNAIFNAGAGQIGNYDSCSFNMEGKGTFKANEGANPFVGETGKLHVEEEVRIETIVPDHLKKHVIRALINNHPYEEVAYDIYPLDNEWDQVGSGMIGDLQSPVPEQQFLDFIRQQFNCKMLRHSKLLDKPITRVAVCGGSGSFLIPYALEAGADLFLTGEIRYHQFFDAEGRIILADIGHYESEQYTIEIFYDILKKNLPTFAVRFSSIYTSPIYYL